MSDLWRDFYFKHNKNVYQKSIKLVITIFFSFFFIIVTYTRLNVVNNLQSPGNLN